MSNPLASLKKSKKPPLYLPDVHTPSPSSSSLDMNNKSLNSEDNSFKFNMNYGFMLNNKTAAQQNKLTNTSKNSVSPRLLVTQRLVNKKIILLTSRGFKTELQFFLLFRDDNNCSRLTSKSSGN